MTVELRSVPTYRGSGRTTHHYYNCHYDIKPRGSYACLARNNIQWEAIVLRSTLELIRSSLELAVVDRCSLECDPEGEFECTFGGFLTFSISKRTTHTSDHWCFWKGGSPPSALQHSFLTTEALAAARRPQTFEVFAGAQFQLPKKLWTDFHSTPICLRTFWKLSIVN